MGAYELAPDRDLDGDMQIDHDEVVAGSDPYAGADYWSVAGISVMSPVSVTFDSVLGRLYAIDHNDARISIPQIWVEFTNGIAGTGSPITIPDPDEVETRNYRVRVTLE